MAIRLISAVRHWKRNALRIMTTSRQPSRRARLRLRVASSMKVAGRKMVVSKAMPLRPG